MVTIGDVAASAGVGAATVSRVLNANPRVSPQTRARVLAAIEILDYRPSPLARGLSRGRSQTVGIVVPFFTHASAVERLRGVVAGLEGGGYDLILFNVQSPRHREEHFAALTGRDRADGLLVMSLPPPPKHLRRLRAAGMPIVLVDVRARGLAAVVTDDVEGGRIATRHLVDLGHRRIAFIGDEPDNEFGFASSGNRERGYTDVLRSSRIPYRGGLVRHGPHDRAVARSLTEALLSHRHPPTAVFAASDVQALGVLDAARAAGLRVPDDLSVVGFDDIEVAAYAELTTVHQPLFDSGFIGARMLLEALEDGGASATRVEQLPLDLIVRSTTAPPRQRRSRGD